MAKKEETQEIVTLRKKVQEGKIIAGKERVIKSLKSGSLDAVYLATNCVDKEDIIYYAKLANVPVVQMELNNEELGVFCKKNFFISVLGTN